MHFFISGQCSLRYSVCLSVRQLDLVAKSVQLHQHVDIMASQFVHLMPEVALVGRDSTSGCDALPATGRDVMRKPPRRRRRDGLGPLEPGTPGRRRGSRTGDVNSQPVHCDYDDDEDKENTLSRRYDGLTTHRSVASPSLLSPSTRSNHDLIYQQCLGSVIASYLSPLGRGGQAVTRSRLHARRFFDTLTTSPGGDRTPVVGKQSCNDDDNNNNDNTNTSVWLSDDSTLAPGAETTSSSGVETATSSSPAEVQLGPDDEVDVVRAQPVPPPESCSKTSAVVALCDVSRISVVSSTSDVPREQLSSLGAAGGVDAGCGPSSAFHSTFNYPLHSTLRGATSVPCPPSPVPLESPPVHRRPVPPRHRDLPPPPSSIRDR